MVPPGVVYLPQVWCTSPKEWCTSPRCGVPPPGEVYLPQVWCTSPRCGVPPPGVVYLRHGAAGPLPGGGLAAGGFVSTGHRLVARDKESWRQQHPSGPPGFTTASSHAEIKQCLGHSTSLHICQIVKYDDMLCCKLGFGGDSTQK